MSLGLHADCKSRLVEALSEALAHFQVANGKFIDRLDAWLALNKVESVLPAKGIIRDQLVNFIDERPFTEFVLDSLAYELRDEPYLLDGPSKSCLSLINSKTLNPLLRN